MRCVSGLQVIRLEVGSSLHISPLPRFLRRRDDSDTVAILKPRGLGIPLENRIYTNHPWLKRVNENLDVQKHCIPARLDEFRYLSLSKTKGYFANASAKPISKQYS